MTINELHCVNILGVTDLYFLTRIADNLLGIIIFNLVWKCFCMTSDDPHMDNFRPFRFKEVMSYYGINILLMISRKVKQGRLHRFTQTTRCSQIIHIHYSVCMSVFAGLQIQTRNLQGTTL